MMSAISRLSSERTPSRCAVVKACMQMAMKPLVVLAKHIFSPDAVPILGEIWRVLRVVARWAPDLRAEVRE